MSELIRKPVDWWMKSESCPTCGSPAIVKPGVDGPEYEPDVYGDGEVYEEWKEMMAGVRDGD